jgi:hypothetical protein
MRTLYFIIIISWLVLFTAFENYNQSPSNQNDELVLHYQKLDANNISTWFRNNGSFNYNPVNNQLPGFEWPKGTNLYARFATGLWLGARVGNDTIGAVADYSFEYLPGYTDVNGVPQGKDDPLYRIYRLTLGINDADRMNWPNALLGNSNQGAPVFFDNLTNSWKPLDFGHQTLFYRMTDSYPESHTVSHGSTAPLKADIMKIDFSVDIPGGLDNVAFSQFTVINRSNNTWNDFYFTLWTDDDLGSATDDKVGCDSALNLGYTYNATNFDYVYGAAPPAVAFFVLRGALRFTGNNNDTVYICRNKTRVPLVGYKDLEMSIFNWYKCDPVCDDCPYNFKESYMYMSGYNRCREPRIHPNGYVTKYIFSGDPVTNQGWINPYTSDQRFFISTGPVNVPPGDTQVIVVAQLIARGTSNLNSITKLRELSAVVKNYYNTCYTSPPIGIEPVSNEIPREFKLFQNYPNPFNPVTKIKFDISSVGTVPRTVRLVIYDALGGEVKVLINQPLKAGEYEIDFDGTDLPSGVYYYRLSSNEITQTRKMVLIK